jgi:peptidoglycan/LPS O-acetylase OafA/YrhL
MDRVGTVDSWTYRFFPTELAFFLFGALSHQIVLPLYRRCFKSKLNPTSNMVTFTLVVVSIFFFAIPIDETIKTYLLFLLFVLLLPFTFLFQNERRWDGWIGNLSYPIYVIHMLVVWVVSYCFKLIHFDNAKVISLVCVATAILFAVGLNRVVGKPFEKIRTRIKCSRC